MKIAIDTQTTLGQKTGFGYYVENLVKELKKVDVNNVYRLISPKKEKDFNSPQRLIWDQFILPAKVRKENVDILHQPAFSAPIFLKKPIVVTIHDLIAIHYPKDIPFWSSQYFGKWMPFSYRFADHIISVSEHTKKDIISLLRVPEEKVTVIYHAAREYFRPIKDKRELDRIRRKYNTGDNYILHIGTLNPRKNLHFLINVFSKVSYQHRNLKLIIAGKEGWYYDNLKDQVNKLGLQNRVLFVGYVDEKDKPALYSGACLLAFPSLYEGFGFPILEAMNCGLPVVASNRSSIPELVSNAGILLNPKDESGWIIAINKMLSDNKLHRKYTDLGLKRAKNFSWKITAEKTIAVYEKVYERYKLAGN